MKHTMKNTLIAAAVAACAVSAPALAAPSKSGALGTSSAAMPTSEYVNVQLAIADVGGGFDTGVTLVGTFGMPLPDLHPNVAFEAEVTKSLIKPEYNWFGNKMEVDYYSLAGYGVYNIRGSDKVNFRVRAGLAYDHVTVDIPTWVGTQSASDSNIGLTIGGGVTVKLAPNMNFIGEYTNIDSDIDHFSAGLQIKF